jgi:streptogramin lyase
VKERLAALDFYDTHSAVPAAGGSVWLTEQGSNKLGRWDPITREITEYQDNPMCRRRKNWRAHA